MLAVGNFPPGDLGNNKPTERPWFSNNPYSADARVEQNLDLQLQALKKAGCRRIFQEKISAGTRNRPEFQRMLDQIREDEGTTRRRMMVVSCHDRIMGHANRARVLERAIQYMKSKDGVWFARKDEIGRWALDHPEHTPVADRGPASVTGLPGPSA